MLKKHIKKLNFLHIKKYSILSQLQLEEALLHNDQQNWCIINEGTPPAIVLGKTSCEKKLINKEYFQKYPIDLIRRFSGGGVVVVDKNTVFVTFIFEKNFLPISFFPEAIFQWTQDFYKKVFSKIAFQLEEQDYTIKKKKCGGNAQYIKKKRALHHTSFLWDFKKDNMKYLSLPTKTPKYRNKRSHEDFLCSLKNHMDSKIVFTKNIKKVLKKNFVLKEKKICDISNVLKKSHRKSTTLISII